MMGAVHVKVKLTNAIDEALVNRGLLAPGLLREYETQGLVDIGAVSLVIPALMVLGLRIRGQRVAQYDRFLFSSLSAMTRLSLPVSENTKIFVNK